MLILTHLSSVRRHPLYKIAPQEAVLWCMSVKLIIAVKAKSLVQRGLHNSPAELCEICIFYFMRIFA